MFPIVTDRYLFGKNRHNGPSIVETDGQGTPVHPVGLAIVKQKNIVD
jgi:hypothetical protein